MAVRVLREATDEVISDPEMQLSKAASEATMASKGHSRLSRPATHAIKGGSGGGKGCCNSGP